jgi:hypothetical protein
VAKLSSYRRIVEQDYDPSYKSLITNLSTTINSSFEELYNSFNNNITFGDNINCTISSFTVTVDTNGIPTNSTSFKLANGQTTAQGLWVIDVTGAKDPTLLPSSGVFVSFVRSESSVVIKNVKGLTPGYAYTLKVLVIG